MASEQWLLNDTSVASGALLTGVGGSSYQLRNTTGATISRTTSSPTPYEGAGCYTTTANNTISFRVKSSANADLAATVFYYDTYVFVPTGFTTGFSSIFVNANDTTFEYSFVQLNPDGSVSFGSYDPGNGSIETNKTGTGVFSKNAWFRVRVKCNTIGANEIGVFTGGNIDGATPSTSLTTFNFSTYGYSNYAYIHWGASNTTAFYFDNIKMDDSAYPTRSTAHTAAATGTGTATGTAAMSNRRTLQATATGTATGTAAASNQRTLAASASATASGTAAMSSTQAMSASASVTASGTAAANVTSLVTFDASATVTASGTASMASTQAMSASATITATGTADGSITPIITLDAAGTITATGTTTFNKQQTLAASASATASATASLIAIQTIAATASVTATATATLLITTPGSLYGNAAKVAGLYGSSTKPTLTTRS
jgi:hypothetical protein